VILPPLLEPGDRVALVAPAGPVDEAKIRTAVERCRYLGLEPVPGPGLRGRTGYLAGPDHARAADLQSALQGDVSGVWAVRGGYGTLRTLQHVELGGLRERPIPFIGFSDNTAIHLALLRLGVLSFHGPHAGAEHFPAETESAFRAVIMDGGVPGPLPQPVGLEPVTVVPGRAEGPLVGGNLALLAATCGTPYQPDTRGAILFFEDVGEMLYRVDRMLMQLRLAGLLDRVAGIAIGEFTEMLDPVVADGAAGEPSLQSLVADVLSPLGVPVVMGLPFGHGAQNWTLPLGARARLDASRGSLEILEPTTTTKRGWRP
jgi:muramoyltetrapeptide carboxypeptidase